MMLETLAQRVLPAPVYETVRGWRARFAPKGSSRDRLAGAVLWSGVGVAMSNVAGLLIGVALARILGREGYGEVGVIVASCTLFAQLGGLGLGPTATKYSAQMRSIDAGSRRIVCSAQCGCRQHVVTGQRRRQCDC